MSTRIGRSSAIRRRAFAIFFTGLSLTATQGRIALSQENKDTRTVADVVAEAEDSVVRIDVVCDGVSGTGSGFVIDDKGTIATNFHVIEGQKSATVKFADGTEIAVAGFLAVDPGFDLALISATPAHGKALRLASKLPRKGDPAIALGAPQGFEFTASEGIVSAIRTGEDIAAILRASDGRDEYSARGLKLDAQWIQTNTPISPGNSGGPLLDLRCEVIGLNSWTRTKGQNLNFAVSASHIQNLVANATREPQPFSALPRLQLPANFPPLPQPAHMPPARTTFEPIELGSGRILSEDTVRFPADEIKKLFNRSTDRPLVAFEHANRETAAIVCHEEGKLVGPAATFFEDGNPMVLGVYDSRQKRTGIFRVWGSQNERILVAEYKADKRHGMCCLFRDNLPWLVQEYEIGKLIVSHVVTYDAKGNQVVANFAADDPRAAENAELLKATNALEELDEKMLSGEIKLGKQVRNWFEAARKEAYNEYRRLTATQRRAAQAERSRKLQESENDIHNRIDAWFRRTHGL